MSRGTFRAVFQGGPLNGQMLECEDLGPPPRVFDVEDADRPETTHRYEAVAVNRNEGLVAYRHAPAEPVSASERPLRNDPVCLVKGCDGGTEVRLWTGLLARRVHDHG